MCVYRMVKCVIFWFFCSDSFSKCHIVTLMYYLGLCLETRGLGLETRGLCLEMHGLGLETRGLGLETHGLGLETRGLGLGLGLGLEMHGLGLCLGLGLGKKVLFTSLPQYHLFTILPAVGQFSNSLTVGLGMKFATKPSITFPTTP